MPYLHFNTFIEAVEFLFEYSISKEIYLVIDEYPYIRESMEGCDSKLQNVIDKYAMNANIKLFLLGSSISIMSSLQNHNNPLYMRFTNSILLKQMDYYDSAKFYSSMSLENKVTLYAVFGGVPFYNAQINEKITVKENIINIVAGQFSGLREFLEIYLKSELRKINGANVVFESIALGAFHFKDILDKSHIESSASLSIILNKLIEMDLVKYVSPINEKTNKQKSGYRISDNCIRFYYNFIYRNESAHAILDDEVFYDTFIDKELNAKLVPLAFEEISKEFLIRKNKKGQFDVVAECNDGYIFFECKYTDKPTTDKTIKEEIEQVMNTTLKPYNFGFISKNGFDLKNSYPYLFFTLKDLYVEGL